MSSSNESSASFGQLHKLLTAKDFEGVFSARRVVRGMRFVLHYRPNGLSGPRLGLVIPKKQARTAVLRNAVKRQTRELFRCRRAGLPPVDLILRLAQPLDRPKRDIGSEARAGWRSEISTLFDQLVQRVAP